MSVVVLVALYVATSVPADSSRVRDRDLYTEIYDVPDLVASRLDCPAPPLGWREPNEEATDRAQVPSRQALLDMVRRDVTPEQWSMEERVLELKGDKLHVTAPIKTHGELQRKLEALRNDFTVLFVQAFLVPVSEKEIASLIPRESVGERTWILRRSDLFEAVYRFFDRKLWEVELVVFDGQVTHGVGIVEESGMGPLRHGRKTGELEPSPGVLSLGVTLQVRFHFRPERQRVIEWKVMTGRTIGSRSVPLADGTTIEIPEIEIHGRQGQLQLGSMQGFAVRGLAYPDEERECVLLVAPLDLGSRGDGVPLERRR